MGKLNKKQELYLLELWFAVWGAISTILLYDKKFWYNPLIGIICMFTCILMATRIEKMRAKL